ncbi:MAG TPA: nitroreductase/quinone reductase family protein [Candidatus Limnocylindrales bacterium]|nr:nitroreductase/quinone reductase family protein [Candidatus Limnocylindrales bacterium]
MAARLRDPASPAIVATATYPAPTLEKHPMTDWDPEAFTRMLVEDMHAHGGAVTQGPLAGQPLLILTTRGAKSGEPRIAILTYTRDGNDYVVAGSKGGAPTDPFWYRNLIANPEAHVEAGGREFDVRATVTQAAERDGLWDAHVAALPAFAEYPEKSGRVIPMIRLTPIS